MERVQVRSTDEQIALDLTQRISRGEYRPGDVLPTAVEAATTWAVPVDVARAAIARLRAHGLARLQIGRDLVVSDRLAGLGPAIQFQGAQQRSRVDLSTERSEVVQTGTVPVSEVDPWIAAATGMGSYRGEGLFRQRVVVTT